MKKFRPPRIILSANGARLAGLAVLGALALAACGGRERTAAVPSPSASPVAPAAAPADDRPVILFVGTSLTAGLGLDPSEAYPARIQEKIDAAGLRYRWWAPG